MNTKSNIPTVLSLLVVLVLGACDTPTEGTLVARASDYELTVGETVSLLAGQNLPNQEDVVRALADLWVDYTLLAEAASTDSTLGNVDLGPLVRGQLEQQMILALRDSVVEVDTTVTEEDVRRAYETGEAGLRVRPRHILLSYPLQATEAQRDSVRSLMRDIREQILAGGDFAEFARTFSQDPGSASQGGDMGFLARGDLVPSLERVAFSLEEGRVSEPVESPFGLHIMEVTDREVASFEEVRDDVRRRLAQNLQDRAESNFIDSLTSASDIEIQEGAVQLVRELAEAPAMRLSGRAGRRPLVTYEGGELTLEEVQNFMQTQPAQFRTSLGQSDDDVIEASVLRSLAQREILLQRTRDFGIEAPVAVRDSLLDVARSRFRDTARQLNLLHIEPDEDQTRQQAVDRRVQVLLQGILAGSRNVIPLGAISYTLRKEFESQIFPTGIDRVLERVEEIRGPGAPPSSAEPPPSGSGGG